MQTEFVPRKRLDWVLYLTVLLAFSQTFLSWPLWSLNRDRTYPLIPLVDLSGILDVYFVNTMLLFAIGLATIGLFMMKNKRLWLMLLLILYVN